MKTYEWYAVNGASKPVMWSGGCGHDHRRRQVWVAYCLDKVEWNTAKDYLTIKDPKEPSNSSTGHAKIIFKKAGWYKIDFYADGYSSGYRHVRFVKNGSNISYVHNYIPHRGWESGARTHITYHFRKDDYLQVMLYQNDGGDYYTWWRWDGNYRSRLQVKYVAPYYDGPTK